MVTRSIESAQRKVEARNFDIRKQLLEYDDVANDQRKTIYALRNELLESQDVSPRITDLRAGVVADLFRAATCPRRASRSSGTSPAWRTRSRPSCSLELPLRRLAGERARARRRRRCSSASSSSADAAYQTKIPAGAEASFRQYERYVMLQILDAHWREHLAALDHLRQGIHLRGYAQKNPKQEYKREAFELFGAMIEAVKLEVIKTLTAVEIRDAGRHASPTTRRTSRTCSSCMPAPAARPRLSRERRRRGRRGTEDAADVRAAQKIGRNDPCPCGSGKKYKHCHGKLT